jgi:hypothetical protein
MNDNPAPGVIPERWKPLPHVPPDTVPHAVQFHLRRFFDLEVGTVYRDLRQALMAASGKILEIGCGLQPYRHLLSPQAEYQALEWGDAEACFPAGGSGVHRYDGTAFPFADGTFTLLFHTEVLEHVYHLGPFLSECSRVLAGEGRMLFTVPFAARNHYIPCDYWRLTPASIARLLGEAGFTDIVVSPRGSDVAVAVHKVNSLCYRLIFRDLRPGVARAVNRLLFTLLFATPVVLLALIGNLSILLKLGSPDDPLGYTVSCRKAASGAKHSETD